uniref:invasion associated locus B family protein n=1 Tax=Roseomonas sp. 18066 TaxID=2681412 RepID=UPI001356B60B
RLGAATPAAPGGAQPTAPAAAPVTFPGGARSVNEEHGDWMVNCGGQDGRKVCAISQSQGNNQTGRRVFTMEVRTMPNDELNGMLLMPFGLRLDAGNTLALDDQPFGPVRAFNTCIEAGCLAPLNLDAAGSRALQRGNVLKVSAENLGSGEAVTFNVSLNGFTSALKRAQELAK